MPQRQEFNTTHWSVVLAARGESVEAQVALEKLCSVYWYPLYAFVGRQGHSPEDAEDLIQGFFARLLSGKIWKPLSASAAVSVLTCSSL